MFDCRARECNESNWLIHKLRECNESDWLIHKLRECNESYWLIHKLRECNESNWLIHKLYEVRARPSASLRLRAAAIFLKSSGTSAVKIFPEISGHGSVFSGNVTRKA